MTYSRTTSIQRDLSECPKAETALSRASSKLSSTSLQSTYFSQLLLRLCGALPAEGKRGQKNQLQEITVLLGHFFLYFLTYHVVHVLFLEASSKQHSLGERHSIKSPNHQQPWSPSCLHTGVNEGVMADHSPSLESSQLHSPDLPLLAPPLPPAMANGEGPQQVTMKLGLPCHVNNWLAA
ncbi:hypothetical protein SKAU_G00086310 [Synaphobranchus kaupii]|uniref:Uncharacterized protein n=1 Tax=Synaphobranchus kaupii TaxID=118154 RepID=A0A9Q1FVM6_SYNKA|nr:hypothetical protein SKAU_G00086310 [Synaphobranchus kaupii]